MAKVSFNYEMLKDPKVAKQARATAQQIQTLLQKSAASVVQIGQLMTSVKSGFTPAVFLAWVECEFGWGASVATNYMQAANAFGGLDCLEQFQPSAVIALARRNVSEEAVSLAVKMAREGDLITFKVAKRILNDTGHKPTNPTAGKARKPQSLRSMARPDFSLEQLCETLDTFSTNIAKMTLGQTERQSLASRFLQLAMALQQVPNGIPFQPAPAPSDASNVAEKTQTRTPAKSNFKAPAKSTGKAPAKV